MCCGDGDEVWCEVKYGGRGVSLNRPGCGSDLTSANGNCRCSSAALMYPGLPRVTRDGVRFIIKNVCYTSGVMNIIRQDASGELVLSSIYRGRVVAFSTGHSLVIPLRILGLRSYDPLTQMS